MDWDEHLFSVLDDLEQQAEALYAAERDLELADRSRSEYAQVSLVSRLMASIDQEVGLTVHGVGQVAGVLRRVGADWCLVGAGQDWLVRVAAITGLRGASPRSVPEVAWSPLTRLGFGSALRRVADSGDACLAHLVDGARHEVVLTRVGLDFVEATGVDERQVLLPFAALAAVQPRDAPDD